jgi:hypothetical protein
MRFSYTPALGVFSAVTMANGDILVPENRLRAAITVAAAPAGAARMAHGGAESWDAPGALDEELSRLLGEPWDYELEPFRCAADGAPVRWLNATG